MNPVVKYCTLSLCIVLASSSITTNDASGKCGQNAAWMVSMNVVAEMISKAKYNFMTSYDTSDRCEQIVAMQTYMDIAIEIINKAKNSFPSCDGSNSSEPLVLDCADLLRMGHRSSGVYTISPINRQTQNMPLRVYCDMETDGGGWTVIQRRGNFNNPSDYFFKDWKSYKEGFGDLEKEFWLGNDNIFALTNQKLYSVRFDLKDVENVRKFAHYGTFWIDDGTNRYTAHISDYSGNVGDSMISHHDSMPFSTKDKDDELTNKNCAVQYKGAWWYGSENCHMANLNGLNLQGKQDSFADGIIWYTWKGHYESLAWTEIKIRPANFKS